MEETNMLEIICLISTVSFFAVSCIVVTMIKKTGNQAGQKHGLYEMGESKA